jgi:hypothetical protein
MNRERDAGGPGHLAPDTLAELEEFIRLGFGEPIREFRLSIRDAGLVLREQANSHHSRQLVQQVLMDLNRAPIRSNEIEVYDCRFPAP